MEKWSELDIEKYLELTRVGLALEEGTKFVKYSGKDEELYKHEAFVRERGIKFVAVYAPDGYFYIILHKTWRNLDAFKETIRFIKRNEDKKG